MIKYLDTEEMLKLADKGGVNRIDTTLMTMSENNTRQRFNLIQENYDLIKENAELQQKIWELRAENDRLKSKLMTKE
jgi:hypothetical protein